MDTKTANQVTSLPGSMSEDEVKQYKEQHDCEVVLLELAGKKAWFRSPDLKIMAAAQAQKSTVDFYRVIAKNCMIAGDTDLINRDKYFIALQSKLDAVINPFEVQVKNL